MSEASERTARQASEAMRLGRWDEAEKLWREVRRLDPRHPQAAFSLGIHAMQRGAWPDAIKLLEEAHALNPQEIFTLLSLAKARRGAGDDAGEGAALEAALALDPYYLPALLAKAQRLERLGERQPAAFFYRNAVKIAPPEGQWPDLLRAQLAHARTYAAREAEAQTELYESALKPAMANLNPAEAERFHEAASILAGRSLPYRQEANQIYVPRLPAIPFYDRSLFAWAPALEAKTDVIREELKAALAKEGKDFAPYVAIQPGQPVDQWAELNRSQRWSHYPLWRNGLADQAHLASCPETRKALEMADLAMIEGLCPNAMFSALAPKTDIPPHTGETNARLVAQLPLVVPENCTYRVGFEQRRWREGELLIFDDTIEHMARNDSDKLRVVLIFDVWNPLLSMAEREAVKALAAAYRTGAGG